MQEFDQNKTYQWQESQPVVITGKQFGIINNFLRTYLSSPEAQTTLQALNAQSVMSQILKQEVEAGNFTEVAETVEHQID